MYVKEADHKPHLQFIMAIKTLSKASSSHMPNVYSPSSASYNKGSLLWAASDDEHTLLAVWDALERTVPAFCGPVALLKDATAPLPPYAVGGGLAGWDGLGDESAVPLLLPLLIYAATQGRQTPARDTTAAQLMQNLGAPLFRNQRPPDAAERRKCTAAAIRCWRAAWLGRTG